MNSLRKYRYLCLGDQVTSESSDMTRSFLSHMGKHVQVLDISSDHAIKLLSDNPEVLSMFSQLKKVIVRKVRELGHFKSFPETLEHVHVQQLSVMEKTEDFENLRRIKNLKTLTSDTVQIEGGLDALVQIAAQFSTISTTIFSLDETLELLLKSVQDLNCIYLKCSTNFIGIPAITVEDVTALILKRVPKTFVKFNEFPNLRSIHITWDEDPYEDEHCYNFHRMSLCPKVEELKIVDNTSKTCMGCFRTLIDSLPNIRKLELINCLYDKQHVKYICFKLPQLRELEVTCTGNVVSSFFALILKGFIGF